jgi:hypothetical protein
MKQLFVMLLLCAGMFSCTQEEIVVESTPSVPTTPAPSEMYGEYELTHLFGYWEEILVTDDLCDTTNWINEGSGITSFILTEDGFDIVYDSLMAYDTPPYYYYWVEETEYGYPAIVTTGYDGTDEFLGIESIQYWYVSQCGDKDLFFRDSGLGGPGLDVIYTDKTE